MCLGREQKDPAAEKGEVRGVTCSLGITFWAGTEAQPAGAVAAGGQRGSASIPTGTHPLELHHNLNKWERSSLSNDKIYEICTFFKRFQFVGMGLY